MPEYLENWKKQNLEKQRNKKGLFSLFFNTTLFTIMKELELYF